MSRDDATVIQIVGAARLIQAFVVGYTQEAFAIDQRTRSAVLYQVLVIGEAAKRLSEEFKERHSAIPWRAVSGMRDRLIHGYDVVDISQVWQTAIVDIPALLTVLEPLVASDQG